MLSATIAATAFLGLLFAGRLVAPRGDAREWSQAGGDASNRCAVDQEPIRGEPTEVWRQRFDAILLGPIVGAGRAVAIVREGKEKKVVAVDVAKGAIVGRKTLDKESDPAAIVVLDGLLAVVDREKTRTYKLAGDSLRAEKTVADAGGDDALAAAGLLLVHNAFRRWQVIDPAAGKSRGSLPLGRGRPCVEQQEDGGWRFVAVNGADDAGNVKVARAPLRLDATPTLGDSSSYASGHLPGIERFVDEAVTVVATSDFRDHVYFWFPGSLENSGVFTDGGGGRVAFQAPPIVHAGRFIGFSPDGVLLELDPAEGKYAKLVDAKELPKGAAIASPSRARNVIYHGNWALEIESRRVLWCVPGLEPDGPLVPAGDGRAVVRTKGSELVGLAQRDKVAAAPDAPTASAAKGAPAKSAPPVRAPSDDVDLAQRLAGDQRGMFAAFEAALESDLQEVWLRRFDRYAEFKLWDECRRVVGAAQKAGLDEARAQALVVRATGKTSSGAGNAELQKKKLLGEEQEALRFHQARVAAAADWCGAHQLPVAATVLARRAAAVLPGAKLDSKRVTAWIPAEFPWPGDAATWAEWAEVLLPSGATFLAASDPMWKRVQGTLFAKDAVALRSPNLLLFSRERSPAVVGPALVRGEAVVASLAALLPAVAPSAAGAAGAAAASEPLEVRLHASRDDYLGEKIAGGEAPEAWSAGVYVPAERVSRFYSQDSAGQPDPLGRGLHETMAHELTHHWLDMRWIVGNRSPLHPSIWLVEGFAEFIGEQSVEAARRGLALDDATVMSLDVTAAAARLNHLHYLSKVLAINAITFRTSLDGDGQLYPLRHTLAKVEVDPRSLFYSQSAALTYFALHRCGEVGRNGYIELLAACYRGEPLGDVATKLGFADTAALEKAFAEFVQKL